MNYLAHLALSGENKEIIFGNFIGDSLHGVEIDHFPKGIKKGIKLHRFIDNFTDHHPIFIEAKKIFSKKFDKYSGVLVDVFFDHFLAKSFYDFEMKDLQKFTLEKYEIIETQKDLLPEKAKQFYNYMRENNLLYTYAELDGIKSVLEGITIRIEHKAPLNEAYELFIENYETLEKLFRKFYREVKFASSDFLNPNKN